jgi:hypothetical protein
MTLKAPNGWLGTSGTVRAHLQEGEGHLTLTVTSPDRILDDPLDMEGLTV